MPHNPARPPLPHPHTHTCTASHLNNAVQQHTCGHDSCPLAYVPIDSHARTEQVKAPAEGFVLRHTALVDVTAAQDDTEAPGQ